MNSQSSNQPSGRVITSISLAVVAVLSVTLTGFARGTQGHFGGDISIGSIAFGGRSDDDIRQLLKQLSNEISHVDIILRLPKESGSKKRWKISAHDLGLGIDVESSIATADRANDKGLVSSLKSWANHTQSNHVPLSATIDQNVLKSILTQLAKSVIRAPKNAQLIFLPKGGFGTRHELPGISLDAATSAAAIGSAWYGYLQNAPPLSSVQPEQQPTSSVQRDQKPSSSSTPNVPAVSANTAEASDSLKPLEIVLATTLNPAEITTAELRKINGEIGEFTTHYGGTGKSRGRNIVLAAGKINGTILKPGDIFSYNKIVGPRVESAGFETAPVIIHGELVPGVGGGICQVSSTLYNAVLLSDLKIINRSHHAFPVHYLPAGRDATVVDGAIDLKFQNNTPAPIYIAASSRHGRLRFRLFGKWNRGREVSIQLEDHTLQPVYLEKRNDPNMPTGRTHIKDKGHKGHRLKVYRVVKQNGIVIRHELISHDRYKPFPRIVIVGTRANRNTGISRIPSHILPQSSIPTGQQTLQ